VFSGLGETNGGGAISLCVLPWIINESSHDPGY